MGTALRAFAHPTPLDNGFRYPCGLRMTDAPENLTLTDLRRIDEKVDRVIDRLQELTGRVGMLEAQYASISARIDRIENRLDRMERRLDLSPTP